MAPRSGASLSSNPKVTIDELLLTHDLNLQAPPTRETVTRLTLDTNLPLLALTTPARTSSASAKHSTQHSSTTNWKQLSNNRSSTVEQQTNLLLQDFSDNTVPYSRIRQNDQTVFQQPWNPFIARSASIHSNTAPLEIQQSKPKLVLDSGYESSSRSQYNVHNSTESKSQIDREPCYEYNDPIDSEAQQLFYLPDQRHEKVIPNSVSTYIPAPPRSIIGESLLTPSVSSPAFSCEQCSKTFNTKSEKTKHMAQHTKKFVCNVTLCSRHIEGFGTRNDLDRHKRSVHGDLTITGKKFRCCVSGCKDPRKVWDRKDNFKAHIARMHKGININDAVEMSQIPDDVDTTSVGGRSHNVPRVEHTSSEAMETQMSQAPSNYMTPFTTTIEHSGAWTGEGDLYDGRPGSAVGQQGFQTPFETSPQEALRFMGNTNVFPSTGSGNPNYALSSTIPAPSTPNDQAPPLVHYRETLSTFMFNNPSYNADFPRPHAPHTAPPGRPAQEQESPMFDWNPQLDPTSAHEGGILPVDPVQHLTQSGSWLNSSSLPYPGHPEASDHRTSSIAILADESQASDPVVDEARAKVRRKLEAIVNNMTQDQIDVMLGQWEKHPPVHNKDKCVVKSIIDVLKETDDKPHKCPQPSCPKKFSQKNRLRKHLRRHERPFFCTIDGCYATSGSKDDLRRHERSHEKKHNHNHDSRGWRCFTNDVARSLHKPRCFKYFDNEQAFQQHRNKDHHERAPANSTSLQAVKNCQVYQGSPGNFWCGFCDKVIACEPSSTDGTKCDKFRYDHIDQHITKEKKIMDQWVDLKSEGQTKAEVKLRHNQPASGGFTEDSEDDGDDGARPSPENTHTIAASSNPHQSLLGTRDSLHPGDARRRKRAKSDADFGGVSPRSKVPKHTHPPMHRQVHPALHTSHGEEAWQATLLPDIDTRSSTPQAMWVTCCGCGVKRHTSRTPCAYCFHSRCGVCILSDSHGQPIYPRASG